MEGIWELPSFSTDPLRPIRGLYFLTAIQMHLTLECDRTTLAVRDLVRSGGTLVWIHLSVLAGNVPSHVLMI